MFVLLGVVVVLIVAIGYLLTGLMNDGPSSDLERDYELLVEGLKRDPDNVALMMTLAEVEYDLGRKDDSLGHARKAAGIDEENLAMQVRLVQLLVRDEKLADARGVLEAVIERDASSSAEPHFVLAQILADSGEAAEAIEHMETGLELQPVAADMRVVFGRILEQAGERDRAIEEYETALRYLPGNEEAVVALKRLGVNESDLPTASAHGANADGGR